MFMQLFDQDPSALTLPAHQAVFREGDSGDQMYVVIAGRVDIVIKGKVVETVASGGVFGEMALLEKRPRNASAVVTEEAKLAVIDRPRFLFLVQQNPYFALHLMTVMAERLRRMDARL